MIGKDNDSSLDALCGAPMNTERFLRVAIGITTALSELHAQRMVHLHINPRAIRVNPETFAVSITDASKDFLAHDLPAAPSAGVTEEMLPYMSPEQTGRMNRVVDYRTDLYSLGAIFYRMVTGTLPFVAKDLMEWVHCHIARTPTPPSEVIPEIPEPISGIIMKLLSKNAEDRYQTASGLTADLEKCLKQWQASQDIQPFPLGEWDIPDRLLIPQKLYGREKDIEVLQAAFNRVLESGPVELVMVAGYSGIGKTSLVRELYKPVVRERGYFISGKFDQYKLNIPYSTIAEVFRELIQQILTESEERVAEWKQQMKIAVGINGQLIVDIIPQVELVIGKQLPVPELPPTETQNRFKMIFRQFISVFTGKMHPLVVFLDDLQWVDSASLKLLQYIITHPDTTYLLLIGAYRDNEVSPPHPLMSTLEEIRKSGFIVNTLVLSPLTMDDLGRLMADTFRSDQERVEPLTRLVYEKTAGNPFFVIQFLKTLYDESLVKFDGTERLWKWDIARIRDKGYTDNVVDLMVGKLRKLSAGTLQEMWLAACIGNRFDLHTLTMISSISDEETRESLVEALREGLLLRLDGVYSFLHDRIQEAAYSFVPVKDQAGLHLRIGRLLTSNLAEEEIEERVFEVVNQLNRGAELVIEPSRESVDLPAQSDSGTQGEGSNRLHGGANLLLSGDGVAAARRLELAVRGDVVALPRSVRVRVPRRQLSEGG